MGANAPNGHMVDPPLPSNMLLSNGTVVLFVITLKLETDNPFHHFLTHPVNVPIIIWVFVLLSQFVPCVIKYNVITCDNLFNVVLKSF